MINVWKSGDYNQKNYLVHRFVYECFNGMITNDKVIDHINDNKTDNRLSNLHLVTQQENCKKSVKNCDYTFVEDNHKNRRFVRGINLSTNQFLYFSSLYSVQQNLNINCSIVKMICEGLNNCKSAYSKIDNNKDVFSYISEQQLPKVYYKSGNKHPMKINDESKRKTKRYGYPKKWNNNKYMP